MTEIAAKGGVAVGGLAILSSLGAWFAFFSNPSNVLNVYDGLKYHKDPGGVWEHVAALTVSVVGSFVLTLVSAWIKRSPFNQPSPASEPEKATS